jgi:hypothetical protein
MESSSYRNNDQDKYQNYNRAPKEKQESNEEEIRIKY